MDTATQPENVATVITATHRQATRPTAVIVLILTIAVVTKCVTVTSHIV